MSDQQNYSQDNLARDLQDASLRGDENKQQQYNQYVEQYQQYQPQSNPQQTYFNASNAPVFIPGQMGGAPGYDQGYDSYLAGGYNPYQGYQQYAQNYQNYGRGGYQGFNNRGGYGDGGYRGGYNNNYNKGAYNSSDVNEGQEQQGISLSDFQKQKQASQASLNKPARSLKLASSSGIKLANATKTPNNKNEASGTSQETTPAPDVSSEKKEPTPAPTPTPEVKNSSASSKEASPAPSQGSDKVATASEKKETPSATEESSPAPAAKKGASSTNEKSSVPTKTKTHKAPEKKEGSAFSNAENLVKQQEEEVAQEYIKDLYGGKDHLSILFMGHVDAGKSTMGGNILYLTGTVDKRTVEKYEKEAKDAGKQGWYLSWVMDTNREERSDGKTIEVGRAYFETEKRRYSILDAPGHKMYVSEMIGGASQADIGVLVISARKGEYETGFEKGGQTREHALLAKTQGVNRMCVVVNKMDDPTVNWSEERYKECTAKLSVFLKGIGFSKEDVVCMPISGYTGAGLKDRVDPKECPWYKGPSLLEYLDSVKPMDRRVNAPFMLPISTKMKDMGTVVEGKIESGSIKKNHSVLLMPNKIPVEITTIFNETEQECDAAFCGEQVRLKIKGVDDEAVAPGHVLTSSNKPVKTVTKFEAQIAIVELRSILSVGFSCVMHLHTAIEEVTFVELKHKLEKGTNRKSKKPPGFAKKGMKIIAVIEVEEPVCAETYGDYPQLGRFTLRDRGTTIAIGKITKLL